MRTRSAAAVLTPLAVLSLALCTTAFAAPPHPRMVGASAQNKTLSQQITVDGKDGDSFTFSGWSKAVLPDRRGGPYQVSVKVTYADNSSAVHRLNFTRTTHPWERKSATFTASKDYTGLTVSATYSRQSGTAWFDDVMAGTKLMAAMPGDVRRS